MLGWSILLSKLAFVKCHKHTHNTIHTHCCPSSTLINIKRVEICPCFVCVSKSVYQIYIENQVGKISMEMFSSKPLLTGHKTHFSKNISMEIFWTDPSEKNSMEMFFFYCDIGTCFTIHDNLSPIYIPFALISKYNEYQALYNVIVNHQINLWLIDKCIRTADQCHCILLQIFVLLLVGDSDLLICWSTPRHTNFQ